jgi:energy-coupling factor transporter transmembrane protein EcfT
MFNQAKTPIERLRRIYRYTLTCGIFSLIFGVFGIFFTDGTRTAIGIGAIFFGILYIVLGIFIQRKSFIALGIAAGFMLLLLLLMLVIAFKTGNPVGLALPLFYLYYAWDSFDVIEDLKNK